MSSYFPFNPHDTHNNASSSSHSIDNSEYDYDNTLDTPAAGGAAGVVHIPHMLDAPQELQMNGAVAAAHELDSAAAAEAARVNFMAQRPSFQVQLPFSAQFQDRAPYGSGDVDDGYTYEFDSLEKFMEWRKQVEEEDTVEFVKGDSHGSRAVPPRFKEHVKLVCARHNRSGRKTYIKKFPERHRKVPSRKLGGDGCPAFISYKTYHDTDKVRAMYNSQHSHEIGLANLPFTRRGRKAEEERKRNTRGAIRGSSATASSSRSAPRMRASSSTSSAEVNITVDPGEEFAEDGPSDILIPSFGVSIPQQHHTHVTNTHPYLNALPHLPPYSPTVSSPLRQHDHPFPRDDSQQYQRFPSHLMGSVSSPQSPSRPTNSFESLHILTQGINVSINTATQLASAGAVLGGTNTGPHTPIHSAGPSAFSPVAAIGSPLAEGFASLEPQSMPMLSPYSQGGFNSVALASHHTSPQSSSNSGSSTHTHSSPRHPMSPLHGQHVLPLSPHGDDVLYQHQHSHQSEAMAQQVPQPQSATVSQHNSGGREQQQLPQGQQAVATMTSGESSAARWERLVDSVQNLRQYAQSFGFSPGGVNQLEDAINGLFGETQVYTGHSSSSRPPQLQQTQPQQLMKHSPIDHANMFANLPADHTSQAQASTFDAGFMQHSGYTNSVFQLDTPSHGLASNSS